MADTFLAWYQRHLDLLQQERNIEIEETSLLLSKCSPRLLEQKGLALLNLSVSSLSIGLGGRSLVELERPAAYHTSQSLPPHTIRPGDLARLTEPSSEKPSKSKKDVQKQEIDGVVSKVTETKIVLAVQTRNDTSDDFDIPQRCHLVKLANDATFDRMEKTLRDLRKRVLSDSDELISPDPLTSVLLGLSAPRLQPSEQDIVFLDTNLNESQQKAVRFVLFETLEIGLIHGPPGTAKIALVEIIRQLVQAGKRILVCGASNLAVDNLVERLSLHQVKLTRLGHPARIMHSLHANTLDYQVSQSDASAIAKDVKKEIEGLMNELNRGKVRGKDRKAKWNDIKELRKEFRKREGNVISSVIDQARVVLATCHGAGGRQVQKMDFDVVVIDEAAQALEAVCWIPILKGKKVILAGDHLQLPPIVKSDQPRPTDDVKSKDKQKPKLAKILSEKAPEDAEKKKASGKTRKKKDPLEPPASLSYTLFDRMIALYGDSITRLLNTQYRMNERIMRFPSDTLYDGRLAAAESVKDRLLTDIASVESSTDDLVVEPIVFYDTAGADMYERTDPEDQKGGDSKYNENEATLVGKHVEAMIKAGLPASSISIISPYQAQVALLTRLLKPRYPKLEIGSIDGFQGRENDLVVVSLVRSNSEKEVGFLKDYRRLNVAMTRPRRQLCVVGDSATVSQGSKFLAGWMQFLEDHADVRMAGMD